MYRYCFKPPYFGLVKSLHSTNLFRTQNVFFGSDQKFRIRNCLSRPFLVKKPKKYCGIVPLSMKTCVKLAKQGLRIRNTIKNIMEFFCDCTNVPELGLDVSVERAVYAEGEGQARPHVVGRHTAA
jgi:hypothetical protein